jgi:hypothetical protein
MKTLLSKTLVTYIFIAEITGWFAFDKGIYVVDLLGSVCMKITSLHLLLCPLLKICLS